MSFGSMLDFSTEEIVAFLKKSSLPTIIVEGNDDIVVYRFIEKRFGAVNISVLPVGGRSAVLEIFERRDEIRAKLFFIADRDTWCITEIPKEFQSEQLAFTSGYSIENDVIHDGELLNYLSEIEKTRLNIELQTFIAWYALALYRHLQSGGVIKIHPNTILDDDIKRAELSQLLDGEIYPVELKEKITASPFDLIRGKSVLAILMRQLSYAGRTPKHHHLSLMETVGANPGQRIGDMFNRISEYFSLTPRIQ